MQPQPKLNSRFLYAALVLLVGAVMFFYGRYHQKQIDDAEQKESLMVYAETVAHYESQKQTSIDSADYHRAVSEAIDKAKKTTADSFARVLKSERSKPPKIVQVTTVYTLECDSAKAVGLQLAGQVQALESESDNLREAVGICDLSNNFLQTVIAAKDKESRAKSDSIVDLQSDINKQSKRKRIWRSVAVSGAAVITGLILVL